MIETLKMRD